MRIKNKGEVISIKTSDKNMLYALAENAVFINAYCGGKGLCRKCRIRYINNPAKPNEIEKETFSIEEIGNGIRLACMHNLRDGDFIEIFEPKPVFKEAKGKICVNKNENYIAIDIGTTTISIALIGKGKLRAIINTLNPQISLGADVLSRIAYSNEHSDKILTDILNKKVLETINESTKKYNIQSIERIIAAANPTMLSFFLGLNPSSIGSYPYESPFEGSLHTKWNDIDVYVPPVISAFIGSDITAGLISIDLNEDFLFIDIGTNCELVLRYKGSIYAASVPGGPALEGSGIDYGMMAQGGAIEKVIYDNTLKCLTIGNLKPVGIAGSGLISAVALLNKYGIIGKSGRILEAWEIEDAPLPFLNRIKKEGLLLENNIYLTQNSIREFQLVKGALNAGIEILTKKTNCSINEIEKIYIAGGFTKSLSKDDIIYSNLLNIGGGFVFLGNSAISGSVKLFCEKNIKSLEEFSRKIKYIEIANEENFQELYIKYMDFV